jgi:hypothetical protein
VPEAVAAEASGDALVAAPVFKLFGGLSLSAGELHEKQNTERPIVNHKSTDLQLESLEICFISLLYTLSEKVSL